MSRIEHKNGESAPLRVMVITISDTRDEHTDKSGQLMMELLQRNHFEVTEYILVKDEKRILKQLFYGADGTVIFSTPGSTSAVRLAMEKLILPELNHIVTEIKKISKNIDI